MIYIDRPFKTKIEIKTNISGKLLNIWEVNDAFLNNQE